VAWRRRRPEGSATRTKGKWCGVTGSGKTRGEIFRLETRGGVVSVRETSTPFAGAMTRGMLPTMAHNEADAAVWVWDRDRAENDDCLGRRCREASRAAARTASKRAWQSAIAVGGGLEADWRSRGGDEEEMARYKAVCFRCRCAELCCVLSWVQWRGSFWTS
jgi:hypothetical protein